MPGRERLQSKGVERRSRKGTLVVFEELWGKWIAWLLGLGLRSFRIGEPPALCSGGEKGDRAARKVTGRRER